MASVTGFLESRLRLRVNREKSAVAPVEERKLLGYRLAAGGFLGAGAPWCAEGSSARRQITKRNRAVSLAQMIGEANAYLTGWVTYFRHARSHSELRGLDGWLCRKLRCVRLEQCKQPAGLRRFLCQHGLAAAGAAAGFVRPRVVVPGQLASGEDRHDPYLVRPTGLDPSGGPPYRVERTEKPPWYVIRMPGGARGWDREEPPYSIPG
jgi:Group II intron, maturase-specific domain